MTQQDKLFGVTRGPGKFELMMSLFDTGEPRRTVEFRLEGMRSLVVVTVTSLEREDGSGESWNFKGWTNRNRFSFPLEGHYSSRNRTGHITFKVKEPRDWRMLEDYLDWLQGHHD